nr:hypothetical protein [Xanthomonadaceae bacterium]
EQRNLRRLRALPTPAGVSDAAVASWAETACRIVRREGFYPPRGLLAPGYLTRWRPTADMQLRLAAERLARLLNRALAPPDAARVRAR